MPALRDSNTQLDLVLGALRRFPGREAFRQDDRAWRYREVADLLARCGAALTRVGIGPGRGVGLLSPNRPEVWLGQVAPSLVGGRHTALHPLGSLDDHLYMVREAELRVLRVDPAYAERVAQLLERSGVVEHVLTFGPCAVGRDVNALVEAEGSHSLPTSAGACDPMSWLLYTGGNTGVPKAAMMTEGGLGQMILNVTTRWDLPSERRYLAVAPISHAAGMMIVPTLMRGGTVVLQKGWDPQRWMDLSTLETIMYGASPRSPTRLVEGIERIGPVFSQLYGQTSSAACGATSTRSAACTG
jgi:fatty-acyl-CoA synthase